RDIRVPPTGACYMWQAGKAIEVTRARRQECGPGDAGIHSEVAAARLKTALAASVERRGRNAQKPVLLALSGGFDSRLTAAVAKEVGLPVELYTYGRNHHREVQVARAVARQLGYNH